MPFEPARITTVTPTPVDRRGLIERLRLTGVAAGQALFLAPALVLGILGVMTWLLVPVLVGVALALVVVPLTQQFTGVSRRIAGQLLDEPIAIEYVDTSGKGVIGRVWTWLRDPARWRDLAHVWFSASGGFVLSVLPAFLLVIPVIHVIGSILDFNGIWLLLLVLDGPILVVWWLVTPRLVRARALADRAILGHGRVEQLERRVSEVSESRSEVLDHSAAEVRRIERDLHDGAQARIAALGMSVGLAEKLFTSDPDTAVELLREARETATAALEDLRTVVRGIHPPVLADRGLAGAVEALAASLPMPITVSFTLDGNIPPPVESAAYFAIAECLANAVKHSHANRAWVEGSHDGARLRLVVGDDGEGRADPSGHGLAGVATRLGAFDGIMSVSSPAGGPTAVTMEVPCPISPSSSGPS